MIPRMSYVPLNFHHPSGACLAPSPVISSDSVTAFCGISSLGVFAISILPEYFQSPPYRQGGAAFVVVGRSLRHVGQKTLITSIAQSVLEQHSNQPGPWFS